VERASCVKLVNPPRLEGIDPTSDFPFKFIFVTNPPLEHVIPVNELEQSVDAPHAELQVESVIERDLDRSQIIEVCV